MVTAAHAHLNAYGVKSGLLRLDPPSYPCPRCSAWLISLTSCGYDPLTMTAFSDYGQSGSSYSTRRSGFLVMTTSAWIGSDHHLFTAVWRAMTILRMGRRHQLLRHRRRRGRRTSVPRSDLSMAPWAWSMATAPCIGFNPADGAFGVANHSRLLRRRGRQRQDGFAAPRQAVAESHGVAGFGGTSSPPRALVDQAQDIRHSSGGAPLGLFGARAKHYSKAFALRWAPPFEQPSEIAGWLLPRIEHAVRVACAASRVRYRNRWASFHTFMVALVFLTTPRGFANDSRLLAAT